MVDAPPLAERPVTVEHRPDVLFVDRDPAETETVHPVLPPLVRKAVRTGECGLRRVAGDPRPSVQHTSKIFDPSYAASSCHWEEAGRVDFPFRLIFLSLKVISCR